MPEKMEKTVRIPEILLNSGHKMPVIGLGCATAPIPPLEELTSILLEAIKIGYRHFDTASLYGTEEAVGNAVAQAIDRGLVKGREEFFITSKLWCADADPDLVLPALNKSLGKFGLEYLDLYLIHWPLKMRPEAGYVCESKDDILPFDMHGTWKAMEDCNKLGLAKSIGVSNFTCEKLSKLLENASIPPAVNQVEMNVSWQQKKLLPFCQQKGIHINAYSPLGSYGTLWGCNTVMENPVLNRIAASRDKATAQVALRWIYEKGASIAVKTFTKERMFQNLQIFDFELSKEELEQIQEIPQIRCAPAAYFLHPEGLIKTVEDLWDGDI